MFKLAAAGLGVAALVAALIAGAVGAIGGLVTGASHADCGPVGSTSATSAGYQPDQLSNAAAIVAVGKQLNVPEQGWVVAVATAMQESGLRNLDYGDRDSLGLFQQRPSQGWGTPGQITNPTYAATQFYQHLLAVPGWQQLTLTEAAQAVQRSAYPDAYARHEPAARQIVAAVQGFPCTTAGPIRIDWPPEQPTVPDPTTAGGRITPRLNALYQALQAAGMTSGGASCYGQRAANPDSDHPKGRACDILYNPRDPADVARGWQTARWLTTRQPTYGITYLIWQGQYWSAQNPQWTTYQSSSYGCPNPANVTGCHYDHVHVSVY